MGERIKETAGEYLHDLREAGGRVWEATQHTVASAGARAAQYGKAVRQRLELASVDRRIEDGHRELGRMAFAARRGGQDELFARPEVAQVLARLEGLDARREALVEEIASARETSSAGAAHSIDDATSRGPVEEEEERHL
ncbi:MAG: hypothetical protein SCH98_13375 [Deferrisomatales bacterium]|nr:hypothetical protein [Deferrisomatales bacterium]